MDRLFFLHLLGCLILWTYLKNHSPLHQLATYKTQSSSSTTNHVVKKVQCDTTSNKDAHAQLRQLRKAIVFGPCRHGKKNSQISWSRRKILGKYQLLHILTPSGLHLAPIAWFLQVVVRWWPLQLFMWALLALLTQEVMLWSMARLLQLKVAHGLTTKVLGLKAKVQKNYYLFFFVVFFLDFLVGTYKYSPMSFWFSYTFLGTLFCYGKNLKSLLKALLITQFFCCCVVSQYFYPLHSAIGIIISSIFFFIYPLLLIGELPLETTQYIAGLTIQFLNNFLIFSDKLLPDWKILTPVHLVFLLMFYLGLICFITTLWKNIELQARVHHRAKALFIIYFTCFPLGLGKDRQIKITERVYKDAQPRETPHRHQQAF